MSILDIQLPKNDQLGLKAAAFKRLGQVVVLAGRNGAGKSRILDHLKQYLTDEFSGIGFSISDLPNSLSLWTGGPASNSAELREQIEKDLPKEFQETVLRKLDSVNLSDFKQFKVAWLTPKFPELKDVRDLTPKNAEKSSNAASSCTIKDLREHALARIEDLQNQWFHARSADVTASEEQRKFAISEYERLQELFKALLGVELGRDLRGHATFYDRTIGQAALSEGQRVLLLWAVMLHSQVDHLSQAILICDEPENHLHPQALLDAIDRVTKALPDVQLWIATHSLPLLSNFDPSSIFWVENGSVEYAGTKPLKVLRGLLGNDERIGRLHDFLGLPANLAANRFAVQCLVEPAVSDRGEGDPQTGQIRNLLSTLNPGKPLRVLDFGAGRGRLAADLQAARAMNDALGNRIDYFALDPSNSHRGELLQRIRELHGSEAGRLYNDAGTLTNELGMRTFDVIVLCNVLHEIPVHNWLKIFGTSGRLLDLLKPGGHVLLVEDTLLPIGESPHPGGFLVLESAPLYEFLMCATNEVIRDTSKSNSRLVAHLIPNKLLERPTQESLKRALAQVVKIADERITELRKSSLNSGEDSDGNARYRAGREHAFYVHQFTNATRALKS